MRVGRGTNSTRSWERVRTLQGPTGTCGMASGEEEDFCGRDYLRGAGVGMPWLESWESAGVHGMQGTAGCETEVSQPGIDCIAEFLLLLGQEAPSQTCGCWAQPLTFSQNSYLPTLSPLSPLFISSFPSFIIPP